MSENNLYALALHGGAGAVAGRDYAETEKHLHNLATNLPCSSE